jgi:hypothetical protein
MLRPTSVILDTTDDLRAFREQIEIVLDINQTTNEMIFNIVSFLDHLQFSHSKVTAYAYYVTEGSDSISDVDRIFNNLRVAITQRIQEIGGYDEDGILEYGFDNLMDDDSILLRLD